MNELLKVLFSTLKAKIISVWTKLKYWTNTSFLRSRFVSWIRKAFSNIFNIKPRNKDDYFSVSRWLIGKRFAFALVIVIGVLSLYFLVVVADIGQYIRKKSDGYPVYKYNSVALRFKDANVKIKAKGGYIAYKGAVKKGYAEGLGELYSEDGNLVYSGNFSKSKFNGNGTLYYPTGETKYQGEFKDNMFEGTGTLYKRNGSKDYKGSFVADKKEGEGTLYDDGDNQTFVGTFHSDNIVYDQFLGKSTQEVGQMYMGNVKIYTFNGNSVVNMKNIDAMYVLTDQSQSIDEAGKVDQVYVLKNTFCYGQNTLTDIKQVEEALGNPSFEGNSYITFPEACGIETLIKNEAEVGIDVNLQGTSTFDEVFEVTSYDTDKEIYMYSFRVDEVTYTFFTRMKAGPFFMYMIESAD